MKYRFSSRRRGVRATGIVLLLVAATGLSHGVTADTYRKNLAIDVLEYVFRLGLSDESAAIDGLATVVVRLRAPGVGQLALDLIGRSPGSASDTAGHDNGTGMAVSGVWVDTGPDPEPPMDLVLPAGTRGAPTAFEHAGDRLVVELPQGLTAGDRVFVHVAYDGVPATGLIIGDNKHGSRGFFSDNWPNKARNWLPTVDHVYEKARSQMVITAPDHYQVVSNGLLVEETDLGDGTRRTHWKQSVPIAPWLYVLGAARFAVQHLPPWNGLPVQTWVYAEDRDAGFYDFAVPTHAAMDFYAANVGPYAYEKLANIQSNSVGGGMEAASAIFYGDNSVTGTRSTRWRNVIIHEIAHQWFGNAVTEYDWDDVWLSEGFATYFTSLFIEHAYGRDEFVDGMRRARDRVFAFYEQRPSYRIVHDNLDDMSQVTTGMQYQKGAWVLHMLRALIGTETFWQGIRDYYAEHFNGHASTDDFRRAMEETSGQDLGWFFEQWLYRGGNPHVQGRWQWVPGADSGGDLVLTLTQTQPGPAFRLPLTIELELGDEPARRHRVELRDRTGDFRLAAPDQPTAIRVDPDVEALMRFAWEAER